VPAAAAAAAAESVTAVVTSAGDDKDTRNAPSGSSPSSPPPLTYPTAPLPPLASMVVTTAKAVAAAAGSPGALNSDFKAEWHPVQPPSTEKGRRPTVDVTVNGKTANFELWEFTPLPSAPAQATSFPASKISEKFTVTRLAKPRLSRDAVGFDGPTKSFTFSIKCDEDDALKADIIKSPACASQLYEVSGFLTLLDRPAVADRQIHYLVRVSEATNRFGLMWRKFMITASYGTCDQVAKHMRENTAPLIAAGRINPHVFIESDVVERMGRSYVSALNAHVRCDVIVAESEFIAHAAVPNPNWHGLRPVIVADGKHRISDFGSSDPMIARHAFIVIGSPNNWVRDDITPPIVPWVDQTVNQLVNLAHLYRVQLVSQVGVLLKRMPENTAARRAFIEAFCPPGALTYSQLQAISAESCAVLRRLIDPRLTISVVIGHAAALRDTEPKSFSAACLAQSAFILHKAPAKKQCASINDALCTAAVIATVYTVAHLFNDHIGGHADTKLACAGESTAATSSSAQSAPNNS